MNTENLSVHFRRGSDTLIVLIGENGAYAADKTDASILSFDGMDWNAVLSPWPAKKVFKGADFAGKGDQFLEDVLSNEYLLEKTWKHRIIAGYSLAGLFSLYVCTKTDLFEGCVSASGSLWYDGWIDYLKKNPVQCKYAYLSLGDREKKARNQRMALVEEKTEETNTILQKYMMTVFEMNPGGHFQDMQERLFKGIQWMEEKII
jgi:predicted alpha/beta superfamily hydrolase